MTEEKKEENLCDVCGEKSVAKESDGHRYCLKHHEMWCKCITHEKMVAMEKKP